MAVVSFSALSLSTHTHTDICLFFIAFCSLLSLCIRPYTQFSMWFMVVSTVCIDHPLRMEVGGLGDIGIILHSSFLPVT